MSGSEQSKLRLRMRQKSCDELLFQDIKDKPKTKPSSNLSSSFLILILSLLSVIYFFIVEMEKKLPEPIMRKDETTNPGRFIAERAMDHVYNLTSLGPRPVGSFENEVLAVNVLTKEIYSVIKKTKKVHRISFDIQKTSGAFPLMFLDGLTNVYRNVQNVIVKIGPLIPSPYSVLVNCHFDTVADSPGGSDDSASCAIMLEIFRVISQMEKPLTNNIIFLFNGAEESLLQASHGFITQHKWAKEIKAFINLEACGAGGREILFQAGPENPWLMQAYSESVPYPLATSLAQEIFQSGVIPGDTDYRIFRDFGNIPGLDFAWLTNGYVYHTKMDDAAHVPLGTLQRTGDNMLSLALNLVSAPYPNHHPLTGNLVFFDVLGAFIVRSSEAVASVLSISILCFSLYTVFLNSNKISLDGLPFKVYIWQMFICTCVVLLSWISSLFLTAATALLLSVLNRAMSWYSRPIWLLFLYIIPSLFLQFAIISGVSKKQNRITKSSWVLYCMYSDANQLIWSSALLICLILRIRSGYIPALWLLFATSSTVVRETLFPFWKDYRWISVFVGMMILPFIQGGYIVNGALLTTVPIMGRSGSGNHSELVLSLIACAMFLLLLNFVIPLIVLVDDSKRILSLMVITSGIALLTLILTPYGFPYSSDESSPSHQRYMILHVERTFHGPNYKVLDHQGGYWVVDLDVNSPQSVMSIVPDMALAQQVDDCNTRLYCGLPYIIPVLTLIWRTHWIPGSMPIISVPTSLSLINKTTTHGVTRYWFSAIGPDHMTLMMSPTKNVHLLSWSFVSGRPLIGPKWNGRDTYFVYYSCASAPEEWQFWIDLKVPLETNDTLIDIAITGHFLHGAHQSSVKLNKLLSQFPPWTVTSGWTATYKSYVF